MKPHSPIRLAFPLPIRASIASALAALLALCAAPTAQALTWDKNSGDGAVITDGSGNWNTTAGNLVWNNAGANPNLIWSQTSGTVGTQAAVFGSGTDGTVDLWTVTLGAAMADTTLTFNNTGYKITGSTLTTGAITVASGKTATINSMLSLTTNNTHNIKGTLNLTGGCSGGSNILWNDVGTVNLSTGTYALSNTRFDLPVWNQTGGTLNLTSSGASGSWIGYQNTVRNVNMTVSGGSFNVNGSAGAYLGIGRTWSGANATLTVKTGGTVNFGNTQEGSLVLNQDGTANTAKLDVQGGTFTVGTTAAASALNFFPNGAAASKNAMMSQSGGTSTINGIAFGGALGTYDSGSLATLQLSGGSLYVGVNGITRGSLASALPVTIQLQGGTFGASDNWSSPLNMKLGAGGVTIQAADSVNTSRNIILTGVLSDDTSSGTFTKTGGGTLTLYGANTYGGASLINAGTLALGSFTTVTPSATPLGIYLASGVTFAITSKAVTLPAGITGITVGMTVSGTGIVAGTTVSAVSGTSLTLSANSTSASSGAYTFGTPNKATVDSTSGLVVGEAVTSGSVLTAGTTLTSISGTTVTLSGYFMNGASSLTFVGQAGSIVNTPSIVVGSSGNFDVSGLSSGLTLGSAQILKASATGASTTGTITVGSGNNLTLGGTTTGLEFTAYGGGSTAPLTLAGTGGNLGLNGMPIKITTTSALGVGPYTLIAHGGSATVTGTPGTLTVAGSSLAANATGTLSVNGSGDLILTISYPVIYDGNTSDGGSAPATQNGDYGTSITAAANPFTKSGYTFFAWNTAADGSGTTVAAGGSYTIPAASTTLYARWTGAAVPTKLVVTTVPTGTTPAGNTFSVTVTAEDNSGNPGQVALDTAISLAASGSGTLAGNTATITSGSSVVTLAGVIYTKAEAITLTASVTSGDALTASVASSSFTVIPNAANVGNSTAVASPTSLAADGSSASTVTVTLQDAYNNLLGAGTNVSWSVTGTANKVTPASSGTTNGSGVASFTVKSITPEAKTVTVNVGATLITNSLAITFTTLGSPNVLTWDPANNTTGSDAAGTWDTSTANWTNHSADFAWPNNGNDAAVFGSGAALAGNYAVALGSPISLGNLTFNTSGANQYTLGSQQTITLDGTPTISVAGAATISGTLAGTGFSKTGAGTLTLSGTDTYTGDTTISTGTLQIGAGGTVGRLTATTAIINNGNLTISRNNAFSQASDLGAGAAISGPGSVTYAGTGTLTLTANNSYDGTTTINSTGASGYPTLTVSHNNALGSTAGGVILYGSATTGGGSTVDLANGITVTGKTLTLDATANGYRATLQTAAGNTATWAGDVVLDGTGGLVEFIANGTGANLTVGSSAANTVTGNHQLFLRGTGIGEIKSSIQVTSGGIYTADACTWKLSGNNTYLGDTVIGNSGGKLQLGANEVIPDGPGKGNVNLTQPGDTLDMNTFSETINGLTGVAGSVVDTVAGGSPTLTVGNNDATSTFAGVIKNTGGRLTLVKIGAGTLTLSGANTYTGNTVANAGTLVLAAGAQLKFVLGTTSGVNNSLTGAGTVTLNGSFVIDTSAADALPSGTWTLENVTSLTGAYGSTFSVVGFTNAGGYKWTKVDGTKFYTFDETTGILTLASPDPFGPWALSKGLDGTVGHEAGKSDDPDHDGHNNLYEFAFDGNPLSAANDGKIVSKIATIGADQVLTLTLPVRAGAIFSTSSGDLLSALIDGLYYRIEGDVDLSSFADSISEVTGNDAATLQAGLPGLSSSAWTYRTFRAPGTVLTAPKAFLRAKISDTP